MRFLLICALWLIALSTPFSSPFATPLNLQNLYINPKNQTLPEVIIFHNSASPCETCPKAINLIIDVLRKNYKKKIHAYLLDEQTHPEFIRAFRLNAPLTLVVIRISDGSSFGYEKLTGLQSETENTAAFSRRITEFINNFLAF